jgi:hypothetical protein
MQQKQLRKISRKLLTSRMCTEGGERRGEERGGVGFKKE